MWMRWEAAIGELDASAIEKFAADSNRYQHRRVPVFGDTDSRGARRLPFRHVSLVSTTVSRRNQRRLVDISPLRMPAADDEVQFIPEEAIVRIGCEVKYERRGRCKHRNLELPIR